MSISRAPDYAAFGERVRTLLLAQKGVSYLKFRVKDVDQVEREGIARIFTRSDWGPYANPLNATGQPVEVRWLSERQRDWRDEAPSPFLHQAPTDGTAEGWYGDPTGRRERRWFSAGRMTSLVRDGAIETREDDVGGPDIPSDR